MPATALVVALKAAGKTIATAESCTGGLVSAAITAVPGSSAVFNEGCIAYSNDVKMRRLGVMAEQLAHGAVSEIVAKAMAVGALKQAAADIAISITGVAGPDGGSAEKPVGTVWIGCATNEDTTAQRFLFKGDREQVRLQTVEAAIEITLNKLA